MSAGDDLAAIRIAKDNGSSKERIVAAAIELMAEGNPNPTADDIAKRANLGRRTVFRQFNYMEQLYEALIVEIESRLTVIAMPLNSSDWREQIEEIADRRVLAFQEFLPFKRVAEIHIYRSQKLKESMIRRKAIMRSFLESIVAKNIADNKLLFEAIDLCLSYETWERLRFQQNLSEPDAREVIGLLLSQLLGDS